MREIYAWNTVEEGVFVRFIGEASGPGKLRDAMSVAVDEQHVFVADSSKKCINVFTKQDGEFVGEVTRSGNANFTPCCLALSVGLLYATDTANMCVAIFEG